MSIKCTKMNCILHILAILANVALIAFSLFIVVEAYGTERFLALLFTIPPILSLMVIKCGGDKEERALKKRIRKAKLRQELKELSEFDKTE